MPKEAEEIPIPRIGAMPFGGVLETIMSQYTGTVGQICTAGIIYGQLLDKKRHRVIGGLVCEHSGSYSVDVLRGKLEASITELYEKSYSSRYDLGEKKTLERSFIPNKVHGTALVAICFVNHIFSDLVFRRR